MSECDPSVTREGSGGGCARGGGGRMRNWHRVATGSDSSLLPECREPGAAPGKGPEPLQAVGRVTAERTDEQKVTEKTKGHAHQLELRTFSPQLGEREAVGGRGNLQCGVGETETLFF